MHLLLVMMGLLLGASCSNGFKCGIGENEETSPCIERCKARSFERSVIHGDARRDADPSWGL